MVDVQSPEGYTDRRLLFEHRLARANRIDAAVNAACTGPIFDGLTLAQIDHDGVLQASVRSLVTTAAHQVPEMDIVIYRGPHSPWGLRLIVSGDEVQVLPVQIGVPVPGGMSGQTGTEAATEVTEEEFDYSQAAELAAMMWKNR